MNALAFERIRYLREHSALPIRLVNVPSPLVSASLIWEYSSFIAATITHPKEVHFLLDLVTEATIQFVRLQVQDIGARLFTLSHEPWYLPPDLGIRVSDDTAQVMSPRGYREFGVPYNTRLSRAFGGIVIHSCGDVGHVLPAMLEIPGLRGVELVATQNDWQRLRDLTKGKVALSLRYCGWDFPDSEPPDLLAYSRELVDFFGRRGVLLWTQTDTLDSTRVLARKLEGAL
jgi:uroporphyrinogen-III decarboxylase